MIHAAGTDGPLGPSREPDGRPVVVAGDESGYEGEKLVGGTTDVFAHGTVSLAPAAAAVVMAELRDRIRSPATEYKANHLQREKHRSVLLWLLGPTGPLLGHSHVCLIDKEFHLLGKLTEAVVADDFHATSPGLYRNPATDRIALRLYRHGRTELPPDWWEAFLLAANDVMRSKERPDGTTPGDVYGHMTGLLAHRAADGELADALTAVRMTAARAETFRERLRAESPAWPPLDPLLPAIVQGAMYWGAGGSPVELFHDRQNALSPERIRALTTAGGPRAVRLVESFVDPRIQLADILAGVARKIASEELRGNADGELISLLRPYVDPASIWVTHSGLLDVPAAE
ncbi:hypothetical protein [Stackebrandtia albiflava]|uniref:hypothetical protein n=1 Tax=Stackebrandtia albiflava TaxID=406432 RepID=UPI001B87C5BF|nr:hypothetical protein [Stackebrandtia albiflava]